MPELDFRGLKVPVYPRVINHGIDSFSRVAEAIDALDSDYKEWEKTKVLESDQSYLNFVCSLGKVDSKQISLYFRDFEKDLEFKKQFSSKLKEMESLGLEHVDDLRFHSLTIYCLVRALKPELMIETGVASGKSSSLALLAMHHNHKGKLISIDLPNQQGKLMADGAQTSTGTKESGWLVPDFLKPSWDLRLGDARQLLPAVLSESLTPPDIFLHDSLHTYEHTKFEFETVLKQMKSGLILCDNIEMGAGRAFNELLEKHNRTAHGYRDLAGFLI